MGHGKKPTPKFQREAVQLALTSDRTRREIAEDFQSSDVWRQVPSCTLGSIARCCPTGRLIAEGPARIVNFGMLAKASQWRVVGGQSSIVSKGI